MTRPSARTNGALLAALGLALIGCVPDPPARWAEGGAPVLIPEASWQRGRSDTISIRGDGRVMDGDDLLFVVDRVGRVVDENNEPVALLLSDGSVMGPDDVFLGRVGIHNASPPWSGVAWLRVRRDGRVALYDADGEARFGGVWTGCNGPATRVCTLMTHIFWLRAVQRYRDSVNVGVGVGMWY